MKRSAAVLLVCVSLLAAPAVGDRIVLKDGRTFEGSVTEPNGKVLIELPYGTLSFPASDVLKIERGPSLMDIYRGRLGVIDRKDPDEVTVLAKWARDRGLMRQADALLREVLELDLDHATARKLLGFVRADGKWLEAGEALKLAEAKLQAGKLDVLLEQLLPALEEVVENAREQLRLKEIHAEALLGSRKFAEAAKAFASLAGKLTGPAAIRCGAIASILRAHPDGMYVLSEPHAPLAMLLGTPAEAGRSGPASLSRPEVLSAALRDEAKAAIKTGRGHMGEGRKQELTEPEAAKAKYDQAGKAFDRADALVPKITRSYRVEIARRRIAMVTKDMNIWAGRFDALKEQLAKRDLTPAAYASLLFRMLRALRNVQSDLETILELATPFDRELILEVTDAMLRLERIVALRKVLLQEVRAINAKR